MSKKEISNNIIIGIVSALGTNKDEFIALLENQFQKRDYHVEVISVTDLVINNALLKKDISSSGKLSLYFKMQYCSKLRDTYCKSIMGCLAIDEIRNPKDNKKKKKLKEKNKIVYIIDQLKHPAEHKILSHVYGISYVQISLFSNNTNRDTFLKFLFKDDNEIKNSNFNISKYIRNNKYNFNKVNNEFDDNSLQDDYNRDILPDGTHKMMIKDMNESEEINFSKKSGQRVSDIFHLSHYFFNLDRNQTDIKTEINKFTQLLFGQYEGYPTQDEFGMALAYHVSYRSTFPNRRHIGACIISPDGEIISTGSIRAPSPSSNTKIEDEDNIREGYNRVKKTYEKYTKTLEELINKKSSSNLRRENIKNDLKRIKKVIEEIIEFHPTSHAELSALADAAKMGISVRSAILYTTTFPCHICAKDIITFGIKKVVYLEQYPKSKNADLYPNIISFDEEDSIDKIPFIIYRGIGPRRYHYVYDLKNKPNDNKKQNKTSAPNDSLPKLLEFEKPSYTQDREKDILNIFNEIVENKNNHDEKTINEIENNQLYRLLIDPDEE